MYAAFVEGTMELSIGILFEYGMEYADEKQFYQDYHEKFECFQKELIPLVEHCESLNREYHLEQDLHQIEKLNRSRWVGGGFGLKGAIKGAVTATMLNMGTDIFRNASDSKKEQKMSKEYERKRESFYRNKEVVDTIIGSLKRELDNMADCVMEELIITGTINPPELESAKAKALLKNSLRFKNLTANELKKVVVQCLRFDPFCKEIYDYLLEVDGDNIEVVRFACTFDMFPDEIVDKEYKQVFAMDESSWENVLEKIKSAIRWEKKYDAVMHPSKMEPILDKLFELSYSKIEILDKVCEELQNYYKGREKDYKGLGTLEAFRAFFHFMQDKKINNRYVLNIIDEFIVIKKIYDMDVSMYIIEAFDYVAEIPKDDDISIEEFIQKVKEKYLQCVSEEEILKTIQEIYESHIYKPIQKDLGHMSESEYNSFLKEVHKKIYCAAIWSRIIEEEDIRSQLIGGTRNLALFLLKNTEYHIMYRSDKLNKIEIQEMPSAYIVFLQNVMQYIKGNLDMLSFEMPLQNSNVEAIQAKIETRRDTEPKKTKRMPSEIVREFCSANAYKSCMDLKLGASLLNHSKYTKAKKNFNLPENDDVFLIYDATIFGGCAAEIVMCTSGVYMKEKGFAVRVMNWQKFMQLKIEKVGIPLISNTIRIGEFEFEASDRGVLYSIFISIQNCLQRELK